MKYYVRENNLEELKRFGEHLRKMRESKNISQEKLAFKSNIAYTSINKLENGKLNTSICTLFELAKALGVKKQDLLNF